MTELLNHAFQEASKLSVDEQDAVGRWLLQELAAERHWAKLLASSQENLDLLGKAALKEHKRGRTRVLDPDTL